MMRYVKIAAILAVGMILGYRAVQAVGKFPNGLKSPVAPTEALLLSGFESPNEVGRWETQGSEIEPSNLHATEGKSSAKVTFLGGNEASAIVLSKAFRARQLPSDWSGYDRLTFDVFNAQQEDEERLIVQLKDQDGKRFKHVVRVSGGASRSVTIPLALATSALDLRHLVYVKLFQWQPDKDAIIYLDNLRLEPLRTGSDGSGLSPAVAQLPDVPLEPIRQGMARAEQQTAQGFERRLANWQDDASKTVRIPLRLEETAGVARSGWIAGGGVPFAPGQVASADQMRLVDEQGNAQPAQLRPLARWSDGSIRWLLVSLLADLQPRQQQAYVLEYGPATHAAPASTPLRVTDGDRTITVDTGPLRVTVSKERFTLFEQVWLDRNHDGQFSDDEQIGRPGSFSLAHRGRRYDSRFDTTTYTLAIEDQGPLSVTLKAAGWFRDEAGKGFCQFIVRLQAFAGQRYVKVTPTFIYTGFPANRYHFKHEGLTLPENETIQAVDLTFGLALSGELTGRLSDEAGVFEGIVREPLRLVQRSHDAFELRGLPSGTQTGRRSIGWAQLADHRHGLSVVVRDFWQQFPKALTVDPAAPSLVVSLWPEEAGELDLQTTSAAFGPDAVARGSAYGLAKTHEVIVDFHAAGAEAVEGHRFARAVQEPVQLRPSAAWVNDTGALGRLAPNDTDRQLPDEVMLERLFDWAVRQQDRFHWYGMLDFGDTRTSYRKEAYDKSYDTWGWHPEGRWGWFNCEAAGTHTGALLQYLRTGKWTYFQFGEDLTRHIMDVDTVHYNTVARDPRLTAVMDDEYSRVGSMHRHNADHWGGRNEEASHTNVVGILLYYYLTGDPRAHDVALEVGEFFLGEHITYSGHPDIAPQRTLANVLWGDVWLYALTRDEAYLKGAVKWAHRLFDGQQASGAWLETHDPWAKTWRGKEATLHMVSYTMPALIAYHRLTNESKAATAIVNGTRYLVDHEGFYPFFDALAYSFQLTGDASLLEAGQARLTKLIRKQHRNGDPDWDGALSEKLTYGRVAPFLYSIPWLFDALEGAQDDDHY